MCAYRWKVGWSFEKVQIIIRDMGGKGTKIRANGGDQIDEGQVVAIME